MFEFEACEVFKIKEFTFVNDCFKYERNEEIGHYGQTLINIMNKKELEDRLIDFSVEKKMINAYRLKDNYGVKKI